MSRIAYLSTYIPKKCGLATYTHHLRQSIRAAKGWKGVDPVLAVTDAADTLPAADPAVWLLAKGERAAYRKAAEKLNNSDVSVVSLQHEFGIFGGEAGRHVLEFVRHLDKPLVTTFHTVFEHPMEPYRSIQQELAERSDRIIVMNQRAAGYLQKAFGIPGSRVRFIPHGTPIPLQGARETFRREAGWTERRVLMTFGLLGRGKGLEMVLRALPAVVREVPQTLYAIVGQTHPEVRKHEGEAYREELQALVHSLGLGNHVVMVDRYLDEPELVRHLMACDLYLTPYPGMEQITSGTLAYAVGLGRPVLSTPYSYARDLLQAHAELLIPYGDEVQWSFRIIRLLTEPGALQKWEQTIEEIGAGMRWPQVGREHLELFREAAEELPVRQAT
ncbi:glycosyltransferase family 4 protein [Paenibacillus sp. S-38]|uniref:glycosyltransferase family 4 protein n=1 Tax=Paenibacillus sp. S-38 TaxID=3416710 RepID=UPI003CE7BC80